MILVTLIVLGAVVGAFTACVQGSQAKRSSAPAHVGATGSFVGGSIAVALREGAVHALDPSTMIAGAAGAAGFTVVAGWLENGPAGPGASPTGPRS